VGVRLWVFAWELGQSVSDTAPTVYFLDSGARLEIRSGCKVCGVAQEHIETHDIVVSPGGIAHYTDEYGDTGCGKDATRNGWWWRA
jgi:hypothetical protein